MRIRTNTGWSTFTAPEIHFAFRGKLASSSCYALRGLTFTFHPAGVYVYFIRYVFKLFGFSAKHFCYVPSSSDRRQNAFEKLILKSVLRYFFYFLLVTLEDVCFSSASWLIFLGSWQQKQASLALNFFQPFLVGPTQTMLLFQIGKDVFNCFFTLCINLFIYICIVDVRFIQSILPNVP